jgi:hypothetical protein
MVSGDIRLVPIRPESYIDLMTTLKVELPDQLREQLRAFVAQGWFSSENELVQEALRRFLEARAPELAARFVKGDVDWGLKGND